MKRLRTASDPTYINYNNPSPLHPPIQYTTPNGVPIQYTTPSASQDTPAQGSQWRDAPAAPAQANRTAAPAQANRTAAPTQANRTAAPRQSAPAPQDPLIQTGQFPSRRNKVLNVLPSGYKYVIERFGRFHSVVSPGVKLLFPLIDRIAYVVDTRELCLRIDPQEASTEDNVSVSIGGNLYLRFVDAQKAAYGANKPVHAAAQLAQSAMQDAVAAHELEVLLRARKSLGGKIRAALEAKGALQKWGCEVLRFEVTDLEPSDPLVQQALNKQCVALREAWEEKLAAEATRQRMEVEAEGVRMLADAQACALDCLRSADARAIEGIGRAIKAPGGEQAVRFLLSQQYITSLAKSAKSLDSLPQDVASVIAEGPTFASHSPDHPAQTTSEPSTTSRK